MKTQTINLWRVEKAAFQYGLLIISVLLAKLLHLYSHVSSLPPILFLLYLPTFLALDAVNVVIFWILVHLQARGRTSISLALLRNAICLILLGASSAQIAFYLETGGELKWGAAKNLAHDLAGVKLLLSGSLYISLVSILIIAIARLACHPLYNGTRILLSRVAAGIGGHHLSSLHVRNESTNDGSSIERRIFPLSTLTAEGGTSRCLSIDTDRDEVVLSLIDNHHSRWRRQWSRRIVVLLPAVMVCVLLIVRPKDFPYAHMSRSLPFTLLDIWSREPPGICQAGYSQDPNPFPFPDLISSVYWEPRHGKFTGWMPSVNSSFDQSEGSGYIAHPSWLPLERVPGFERWYAEPFPEGPHKHHRNHFPPPRRPKNDGRSHRKDNYDPVKDPLRITNLDQDLLGPITKTLKDHKVVVKHVVMLSLESMRKDVFPLKKDSHLHDLIMQSHSSNMSAQKSNSELAKVSKNAELLTGESGGFANVRDQGELFGRAGSWRNLGEDRGGINIVGALTGGTATLKSMLGSHCGVHPLPVDFTVEARAHIYQPCLPSILKLFNRNKSVRGQRQHSPSFNEHRSAEFASMPWKSVFVQAITDQFDQQDMLNRHLGFSQMIVREDLLDPASEHYPPTEKESNYFGFPERQVKPYLQDQFREAEEKGYRLFLSHLTSSTHHPWNTPESAGQTIDYFGRGRWHPERSLNRYLNTVRYSDEWIGEIMDMLEDLGVAEQTLVVLVGDHGMAFKEDSSQYTTFENGHITNLRVPLVFHHPSLPRIQLAVNATSMSILPTILDLLVATSSLNNKDSDIASNLIHQYEGQSLIRPYQVEKNGRQAWNIGVISAGGAILSVSSAAVPYRLILPVCKSGIYKFTSVAQDPNELHPLEEYSISALALRVEREHGQDAAKWVIEAEKIGKWWVAEQKRRWRYYGASLQDDRRPEEMKEAGKKKLEHWWDT